MEMTNSFWFYMCNEIFQYNKSIKEILRLRFIVLDEAL